MSASCDFSRRFFAEFIAARVKAWGLDEGGSRPRGRAVAGVAEAATSRDEPEPLAPSPFDEPRDLLSDLGATGP